MMKVESKFKNLHKHLEKKILPAIESIMEKNDWIFILDSAPSHRSNLVQDLLTEKIHKRFVNYTEWLPTFLNCNPLEYLCWDEIKIKVYGGRFNQAFANEKELKKKIKRVWPEVSNDLKEIRMTLKQFISRLT